MTDDGELVNLASERLGALAIATNDDFFAVKENLVRDAEPIANDEYTDRGKWMDGWETRRRREPGHDWCVIRLGARGVIRCVIVDTTYFKGNHPPECSIDALDAPDTPFPDRDAAWQPLLGSSPLAADAKNEFTLPDARPATHLRLNIFPDGGVARLRALGEVAADPAALASGREVNLAAIELGALVVRVSDMFFGHRQNLIMPGRANSMRDGWETRRRRGPGHDWAIVRLAAAGPVHRVEVDTCCFKGNAPASCSIEALSAAGAGGVELETREDWQMLLPETRLSPDTNHIFERELRPVGAITHVRLNIFPDGGVSRLLVWGVVE